MVKTAGDLNQPLILVSSYPTFTTSWKDYAITHDVSNLCMFALYAKLGLERTANGGVLHIDETLLRIDKLAAEKAYRTGFYSSNFVPSQLRRLWDQYHFTLFDLSKATVGLTVGTHGAAMLLRYLNSRNINFEMFLEDGSTSISSPGANKMRMPLAVKQFTNSTRTTLERIWYCTLHPEVYGRSKSYKSDPYKHLLHERLMDMALVVAYGRPSPRPTYLSTMQYFTGQHSGVVVPVHDFEELDIFNKEAVTAIFQCLHSDQLQDSFTGYIITMEGDWTPKQHKGYNH